LAGKIDDRDKDAILCGLDIRNVAFALGAGVAEAHKAY